VYAEWFFFTCSELRHPNIVQFVGMYQPSNLEFGSLPALVMEKMDRNLFEYVDNSPIPLCTTLSILHDTSQGMCYLHDLDPPCMDTPRPDTS